MTDNEIIKALEICADDEKPCDGCVFHEDNFCGTDLEKAALALIQRQQEEIKLLKQRRVNMFEILEAVERGRAKGIKELRDKIVEQLERISPEPTTKCYAHEDEYTAAFEMHEKCMAIVKGVQNEQLE